MGADFIGAIVPIRRTREEAKQALHEMPVSQIMDRIKYTQFDPEIDSDLYTWENDDATEPNGVTPELMKHLEDCIDITYDVAEGRYRLGGVTQIDDVQFAIAGGPSWGDTVDYVDELSVTSFLGVTVGEGEYLTFVSR